MQYVVLLLLLALPTESCAINVDEAILVANKEISKLGLRAEDFDVEIDQGNKIWNAIMADMAKSQYGPVVREFNTYREKTRDKEFWVITYSVKAPRGFAVKDGGATVLVDKQAGVPLVVIGGE